LDGSPAKGRIIEFLEGLGFQEKEIIHKGYVAILFERIGVRFEKGSG
jgi:hypothetical protein